MVQSSVADPTLRDGQRQRHELTISRACEGALSCGNVVKFGTSPRKEVIECPTLPVADVDAIMTAAALSASTTAQALDGTNLDGGTGRDRITPCRSVTVTFAASDINDWNTVSGECVIDVYGIDARGSQIQDQIRRPNDATTATYETRLAYASVSKVDIPKCVGSNGLATMGVNNSVVELSRADYPGVAIYNPYKESASTTREFAQYDAVEVMTKGDIAVEVEHAVSVGDQAFVRVLLSGTDLCGQFAGQDALDDPGTYARLEGAHYIKAAAADAVAIVRIGG